MENKPVLIFKNDYFTSEDDLNNIYRILCHQRDEGIILLPPYISLVGVGNADGTAIIDANGKVIWGENNGEYFVNWEGRYD